MINRLFGLLTEKGGNRIFIRCGGIEWELSTPASSIAKMPDTGTEISVYTILYHREDRMELFGFFDLHERSVFMKLIKINGIGPKQAIKILSSISVQNFLEVVDSGNSRELAKIPGLGLKTSQKIILALKGKVDFIDKNGGEDHSDIVNALSDMGFDKKRAGVVVSKIYAEIIKNNNFDKEELEKEIFRQAIILLSS